jgi:putative phage-type endonuclease
MEPYTPEWYEARKTHIGSSDASILMGVGRKTRYRLWMEKMGYLENVKNAAMRRGSEMEPMALAAYMDTKGMQFAPKVIFGDEPWYMASLDGVSEDGKHAVELKMAGADNHAIAVAGRVPEEYYPQLQHQLIGLGLETIDYHSVPHFSTDCRDGVTVVVHRDQEYMKRLKPECHTFWEKNLIEGEMPTLTHLDMVGRVDPEWIQRAEALKLCMAEIKLLNQQYIEPLEVRVKALREELEELAGNDSCEGGGIRLTRIRRKGNLDAELLGQEIQDLDKYRKPATWSYRLDLDRKK